VNHKQRKILIAEATWKVIVNEGIEKATVIKIANGSLTTSSHRRWDAMHHLLQYKKSWRLPAKIRPPSLS